MQKLFEAAQERIRTFVEQRRNLSLVVGCSQVEMAYVLKMLEAIEQDDCPDVFWAFPYRFESPGQFVRESIEGAKAMLEVTSDQLVAEGEDPLPPLSLAVLEPTTPPVERMRALLLYAREILPAPDAQRIVVNVFPAEVLDPHAYARFVLELTRHQMPKPWCAGMRMVFRDPKEAPTLRRHLEQMPRTEWYEPDFSQHAIEASLEAEAYDEELPLPRRMQALVMVAALDYAHRRYEAAIEKYSLVKRYFAAMGNHLMVAVALNGLGEVFYRTGNYPRAREHFEKALTPAIDGKAYAVLLNTTLNLGHVGLMEKRYEDAISYYDEAGKLSMELRNAELYALCMEYRGQCDYDRKLYPAAAATWIAGAAFARELDANEPLERLLVRLQSVFQQLGLRDRVRETEEELLLVRAKLAKDYPHGRPEVHA